MAMNDFQRTITLTMRSGENGLFIPESQQDPPSAGSMRDRRAYLDPGVYLVQFSFDGPKSARLFLNRNIISSPSFPLVLAVPAGSADTVRSVYTTVTLAHQGAMFFGLLGVPDEPEIQAHYSAGVVITKMGVPDL